MKRVLYCAAAVVFAAAIVAVSPRLTAQLFRNVDKDLQVLDRNPLDDIRNSESLAFVMLNGRLYNAKTLDEIGDTPRPRRPFWFELPERGTR
jgi:hypothetical protein